MRTPSPGAIGTTKAKSASAVDRRKASAIAPARHSLDSASSLALYSSLLSGIEEVAAAAAGEVADASAAPQTPPQQAAEQRSSASGAQFAEGNSSPDSSIASSTRPSFAAARTASLAADSSLLSYIEAAAVAADSLTAEAPTAEQNPSSNSMQQGPSGLLQPIKSPFAAAEVQFLALAADDGTEDGQWADTPPSPSVGQMLPRAATAISHLQRSRPPAPDASSRRSSADQAPGARRVANLPPVARRAASLPQPEASAALAVRPDTISGALKAVPSTSSRRRTRLAAATGPGQLPSMCCRAPVVEFCAHALSAPTLECPQQTSATPPQPHTPCSQLSSELAAELELADELAAQFGVQPQRSGSLAAALPPATAARASCFLESSSAAGTALLDASTGWRLLYVDTAFAAATGVPHGSGGGVSGPGATFWQHFEVLGSEVGSPANFLCFSRLFWT